MEHTDNLITLRGQLAQVPGFSHENHGKRFYRFVLDVPRLSGTVDSLPVVAEQSLLGHWQPEPGCQVTVTGQIRSHNLRREGQRHLMIFVFANLLVPEPGDSLNDVMLEGIICRSPTYRQTPLGREICDVMLAVPRGFQRSDYLPCILWGKTAQQVSQGLPGDRLRIRGRLQSRSYTKATPEGAVQRTAYEISALTGDMIPDSQ